MTTFDDKLDPDGVLTVRHPELDDHRLLAILAVLGHGILIDGPSLSRRIATAIRKFQYAR